MATVIAVRGLQRAKNVRLRAYDIAEDEYSWATLSPTENVLVDVDDAQSRRALAHHNAIGQFVVVGTDVAVGGALGPS